MRTIYNLVASVVAVFIVTSVTYAQQQTNFTETQSSNTIVPADNPQAMETSDLGNINYGDYPENREMNVRVYPNPSIDFVYINSSDLVGKSYIITDLTGKAVAAQQTMNENLITLDVSSYPSGYYFVRYENGTVVKFIVKK